MVMSLQKRPSSTSDPPDLCSYNVEQYGLIMTRKIQYQPLVQCVTYFVGTRVITAVCWSLYPHSAPWAAAASRVTTIPFLVLWTRAFGAYTNIAPLYWTYEGERSRLRQTVTYMSAGTSLGVGAFLFVVGVAMSRDWLRFPHWGWQVTPLPNVAYGVLLNTTEMFAVAVTEELVYRGYSFDLAVKALGKRRASVMLALLFALMHRTFLGAPGVGAGALALTSLRLMNDNLWLPIGYHFGWNVIQSVGLDPPATFTSIRPAHITGPALWLGQFGKPVPGVLATLVHLLVMSITFFMLRRRHKHVSATQ